PLAPPAAHRTGTRGVRSGGRRAADDGTGLQCRGRDQQRAADAAVPHRRMTQGLLDLKRLYWNCRRLPTGKRRGHSPYEVLGGSLPTYDFWELLHWPLAELAQHVSTSEV